jgi:putative oxidoreductase
VADELNVNSETRLDHGRRGEINPAGRLAPRATQTRSRYRESNAIERQDVSGKWREWPGNSTLLVLGRAIFGGYFLYNGLNHFKNRQMLAEYARSKQVPSPEIAVTASGALLVLGGLSVLTGVQPKIGASLIGAFLLGVSPQMHDFWRIEDRQQQMAELVNFTKNMALVGGACLVAALPEPWPASVPGGGRALSTV